MGGDLVALDTQTRHRRTKREIEVLREAMFQVVAADHPVTVRGVFYRMVSAGLVAKTEVEYSRTVDRLLIAMRREGDLPYNWIADNTRWVRKPQTYSSVETMLQEIAGTYRRTCGAISRTTSRSGRRRMPSPDCCTRRLRCGACR